MNINQALPLLGGLSPVDFMRHHWQKKPLLIRQAVPGFVAPLNRADVVALAALPEVESRLVEQKDPGTGGAWQLKHGPFARRSLPPFKRPGWTLLVQSVDLHHPQMHALLDSFRFIPNVRLDDMMVSYATDQGGVGPHFDSYDVFLLQAHGRRRWRIGQQKDLRILPDMPLKILSHFAPEQEFVLEPGDMLYLPPRYAHDGIAEGECMTYSVGFRAPGRAELASDLLQRLAENAEEDVGTDVYQDPQQAASEQVAAIPVALHAFAKDALADALRDPAALEKALGELLTEPKASVSFSGDSWPVQTGALCLDRRTRMLYDAHHVFINGESFLASGRDAQLMHVLADTRRLNAKDAKRLSAGARELVADWVEAGWLNAPA